VELVDLVRCYASTGVLLARLDGQSEIAHRALVDALSAPDILARIRVAFDDLPEAHDAGFQVFEALICLAQQCFAANATLRELVDLVKLNANLVRAAHGAAQRILRGILDNGARVLAEEGLLEASLPFQWLLVKDFEDVSAPPGARAESRARLAATLARLGDVETAIDVLSTPGACEAKEPQRPAAWLGLHAATCTVRAMDLAKETTVAKLGALGPERVDELTRVALDELAALLRLAGDDPLSSRVLLDACASLAPHIDFARTYGALIAARPDLEARALVHAHSRLEGMALIDYLDGAAVDAEQLQRRLGDAPEVCDAAWRDVCKAHASGVRALFCCRTLTPLMPHMNKRAGVGTCCQVRAAPRGAVSCKGQRREVQIATSVRIGAHARRPARPRRRHWARGQDFGGNPVARAIRYCQARAHPKSGADAIGGGTALDLSESSELRRSANCLLLGAQARLCVLDPSLRPSCADLAKDMMAQQLVNHGSLMQVGNDAWSCGALDAAFGVLSVARDASGTKPEIASATRQLVALSLKRREWKQAAADAHTLAQALKDNPLDAADENGVNDDVAWISCTLWNAAAELPKTDDAHDVSTALVVADVLVASAELFERLGKLQQADKARVNAAGAVITAANRIVDEPGDESAALVGLCGEIACNALNMIRPAQAFELQLGGLVLTANLFTAMPYHGNANIEEHVAQRVAVIVDEEFSSGLRPGHVASAARIAHRLKFVGAARQLYVRVLQSELAQAQPDYVRAAEACLSLLVLAETDAQSVEWADQIERMRKSGGGAFPATALETAASVAFFFVSRPFLRCGVLR